MVELIGLLAQKNKKSTRNGLSLKKVEKQYEKVSFSWDYINQLNMNCVKSQVFQAEK